jgi:hypothetical protein
LFLPPFLPLLPPFFLPLSTILKEAYPNIALQNWQHNIIIEWSQVVCDTLSLLRASAIQGHCNVSMESFM